MAARMNIPTDSLHKFIAVGGLALTAAAGNFGYATYAEQDKFYEAEWAKYAPIEEERLKQKIENAAERASAQAKSKECWDRAGLDESKQSKCLSEDADSMINAANSTQKSLDFLAKGIIKHEASVPFLDSKGKFFRVRFIISFLGCVIGVGLAIFGFSRWRQAEALSEARK